MQQIVTFNVGGKCYETTASTLNKYENTTISMLLKHNENNRVIFIDRDSEMFRWILYWYRTGIIVDHTTVQVPQEVWEHELEYYGIGEEEILQSGNNGGVSLGELDPKRRKINEDNAKLRKKASDAINGALSYNDRERMSRENIYKNLIEYMIDNLNKNNLNWYTTFEFIGRTFSSSSDSYGPTIYYPAAYDTRARINPCFIECWFDKEFSEYCSSLGFTVTRVNYMARTTVRKFKNIPASFTDETTPHSAITIMISVKK